MGYPHASRERQFVLREDKIHIQQEFLVMVSGLIVIGYLHFRFTLRTDDSQWLNAPFHNLAVSQKLPLQGYILGLTEEEFIFHQYAALLQIQRCHPDVLVVIAHFMCMRIGQTVGTEQPIAVEVVVRRVIAIVVAAVGEMFSAVSVLAAQSLICKIPYKAALKFRICASQVPVVLETAHRVAHGMSILALDERLVIFLCRAPGIIFATPLRSVHGAVDVGVDALLGLFKLYGSAWVNAFDPLVGSREVGTIDSLIAQTPDDDAGMIPIEAYIVLVALKNLTSEERKACQRLFLIPEAVAFLVGFGAHVETVLVAEVVP